MGQLVDDQNVHARKITNKAQARMKKVVAVMETVIVSFFLCCFSIPFLSGVPQ
jgi:hypothetical protein